MKNNKQKKVNLQNLYVYVNKDSFKKNNLTLDDLNNGEIYFSVKDAQEDNWNDEDDILIQFRIEVNPDIVHMCNCDKCNINK